MNVKLNPVESSNIAAVGYDRERSLLFIRFVKGGTYQYDSVPIQVYVDLMNADSVGKFFHANIRHVYAYHMIGEADEAA